MNRKALYSILLMSLAHLFLVLWMMSRSEYFVATPGDDFGGTKKNVPEEGLKRMIVYLKYLFLCLLHLANIASDLVYILSVPKYNSDIQQYLWTFMKPSFIIHGGCIIAAWVNYKKSNNYCAFWIVLNGFPLFQLSNGVTD